jgi:hypothetical protein
MANLNLDEILALFENGERRYAEDPIFKSVADSLKMGLGVYAVLDHTLKEQTLIRGNYKALAKSRSEIETELNHYREAYTNLLDSINSK